jgi:hypothetical protein
LQGPPLLGFGDGVLDADSLRGLLVAGLLVGGGLLGSGVLARLLGRGGDLPGEVTGQARYPESTRAFTSGRRRRRSSIPSVRSALTSYIRPGRIAPVHNSRPSPSLITVGFIVFCFFLPDTNARRPGLCAAGRLTCTSVPSMRSSAPSAAA